MKLVLENWSSVVSNTWRSENLSGAISQGRQHFKPLTFPLPVYFFLSFHISLSLFLFYLYFSLWFFLLLCLSLFLSLSLVLSFYQSLVIMFFSLNLIYFYFYVSILLRFVLHLEDLRTLAFYSYNSIRLSSFLKSFSILSNQLFFFFSFLTLMTLIQWRVNSVAQSYSRKDQTSEDCK